MLYFIYKSYCKKLTHGLYARYSIDQIKEKLVVFVLLSSCRCSIQLYSLNKDINSFIHQIYIHQIYTVPITIVTLSRGANINIE